MKKKISKKEKLIQKITLKRSLIDIFYIALGIISASFGLEGFLVPNGFIDGGVTGISLLLTRITGLPLAVFLIVINLPFILLGYFMLKKKFTFKVIVAILGLALVLFFFNFPLITRDFLLNAIFGGFFLGAGIGLVVRGGALIDGTDIFALYISKKINFTIGDVILVINIVIFSFAGIILGIEPALYSIITFFTATRTANFIIFGIEEYTGVTIISNKSEDIRMLIIEELGRGVTIYRGKRGYGKRGDILTETDVIFTVLTKLEVTGLKAGVEKIDPSAFIVFNTINDIKGGMIKKRPLFHG